MHEKFKVIITHFKYQNKDELLIIINIFSINQNMKHYLEVLKSDFNLIITSIIIIGRTFYT